MADYFSERAPQHLGHAERRPRSAHLHRDRQRPDAHRQRHVHRLRPRQCSCTGTPAFTSGAQPLADGPPPTATSGPFTPTAVGTYRWVASYSGDDHYLPVSGQCDDPGETSVVTAPANGAPEANDDRYLTTEDTPLNVPASGVLGNDDDDDRSALSAVLATGPVNGTLVLGVDGSFSYTSNPNFSGTDSFTYRASDSTLESQPATVIIDVTGVNDAPRS